MPIHHTSDSLPSTRAGRGERSRKQSRTERLLLKCLKSSRMEIHVEWKRFLLRLSCRFVSLIVRSSELSLQSVNQPRLFAFLGISGGSSGWDAEHSPTTGDSNANFSKTKLLLVFVSLVNHLINFC